MNILLFSLVLLSITERLVNNSFLNERIVQSQECQTKIQHTAYVFMYVFILKKYAVLGNMYMACVTRALGCDQ